MFDGEEDQRHAGRFFLGRSDDERIGELVDLVFAAEIDVVCVRVVELRLDGAETRGPGQARSVRTQSPCAFCCTSTLAA